MSSFWVIVVIIVAFILFFVSTYNRLVRRRNRVREAWADIDVQLKRRHNLIPNLVSAVKGYMSHEKGVLENVTNARASVMKATSRKDIQESENMLTDTLKSLFAVAESYPDLKASANFIELQREVRDAEDKIQAARRFYNTNVRDYNTSIESIPTNLVASLFKFKHEELFKIEIEAERGVPIVEF